MRDIYVGKRGPEAAGEDQPDKLRKTVRSEQEAPGSALVQKSGHVADDVQISALDAFYEMDGRKSRYIGEVKDCYRGGDAGDVKRRELVEKWTCLNALEGKFGKINQKIVMDEELVQNGVMDGKFVKNFVMDAKIDPKVVMDLSFFKIGGWNSLQPINQNLLEEFIDKKEPWLLIGIPSRDPFLVTQYLERHSVSSDQHIKKLMSLREGLHVMMQFYMRQHFADRYWLHDHPGGHASWREYEQDTSHAYFLAHLYTHLLRTCTCMAQGVVARVFVKRALIHMSSRV